MKKKLKKSFIAMLAVAMVIGSSSALTIMEPVKMQAATKQIKITNVPDAALTIKKGSTYRLKAKLGTKSNLKYEWKSSNSKKVSVTKKGIIKGLKNGKATIKVSVKGKNYTAASIKVTVGTKVSKVKVIKPAMIVAVGSTATIKSEIVPSNASNQKLKYTSSNTKVAKISSKGVVSGLKAGTVKIKIKATDGSGKKTTVTVKVEKDIKQVKLVDDFYQSANAEILKNTDLDLKVGSWNQFSILQDEIDQKADTLIEETAQKENKEGTAADTVSDLYQTAVDTDARDKQGIKTIQPYLDEIEKVSDMEEYLTLEGKLSKEGMDGILSSLVYNDFKDIKNFKVYFDEIDTGITNIQFSNILYNDVKKEYKNYVQTLLKLSGESETEASSNASKIISFQKNIATTSLDTLVSYDIDMIYHPYTVKKLKNIFTNCDISDYIDAAGYGDVDEFIVVNPAQMERINKYLKESNLDMLKEYAKLIILCRYAPYMSEDFYQAYEKLDAVENMEEEKNIEDFSKSMLEEALGWEVSKLYIDAYVPDTMKTDVTNMVDLILKQYHKEINQSTWLSSTTKANAIKKLDHMQKNISYPEDWTKYLIKSEFLSPKEGGTLSDNIKMLYTERKEAERGQLGTTETADEWMENPLLINAYYMPEYNSITIPIGITGGAFYDSNKSDAANLGALGVVIGHEISHAFDETGADYDENGNKKNWWTTADTKKYKVIMKKLESYYDTFEVLPGVFEDGKLTLSENIADLAGATCAMQLVDKNSKARKEFFESYANIWAGEMTKEVTQLYLLLDVHANQKVRVNAIISLMDEFYETYNVKKTDAMYVAPENRIKIW